MHRSYSDAMLPKSSRKEWRQRFSFRQKSLKSENQVSFCILIYLCHNSFSIFRKQKVGLNSLGLIDHLMFVAFQSFYLFQLLLGWIYSCR